MCEDHCLFSGAKSSWQQSEVKGSHEKDYEALEFDSMYRELPADEKHYKTYYKGN